MPNQRWIIALTFVCIVGLVLYEKLNLQYGATSKEQKIFSAHHAEIWQFFCDHSQVLPFELKSYCTNHADCVLAVARVRKPCESMGKYSGGLIWLAQQNRNGEMICRKMKAIISVNAVVYEGPVIGAGADVSGLCSPETVRLLVQSGKSSEDGFFDQPPMAFASFSERAVLMGDRNGSGAIWEDEMKKAEGTSARYSDQQWNSLPKQDDKYYSGLKDYVEEFARLQAEGKSIY